MVRNASQVPEESDQVVVIDLPPPSDIPVDEDRVYTDVAEAHGPVQDLLKQADVTAEGDNVDQPQEAAATESEVKDELLEAESSNEDRDKETDRTVHPESTHSASVEMAQVNRDNQSSGHDEDVDDEVSTKVDATKHDNKDEEISDDDDGNDDEDKDIEDDEDNEAFEDAQAHPDAEWFSHKRDRPDDSSSDSSESSFSYHLKKGKVIQVALTFMKQPLDPYNLKLPDSPELIMDDPQDPEFDDEKSSPFLDTESTDYQLTQPTPICKVHAASQQSTFSLDVFLSKKATCP